jgi:hypothetical protein
MCNHAVYIDHIHQADKFMNHVFVLYMRLQGRIRSFFTSG